MGIGTSNLVESLVVSGSVNLIGAGIDSNGSIQYEDDDLSVYHDGEWITLTMVDTNTQLSAYSDLVFDFNTDIFHINTENAVIGNVLKWNGDYWVGGSLDQFTEVPTNNLVYQEDLTQAQRLLYDSGNIGIGVTELNEYPFFIKSLNNTAAYFESESGDIISFSVNPVGVHFQGYYTDTYLNNDISNAAGIYLNDSDFNIYIQHPETNATELILTMDEDYIGIGFGFV